MRARESLSCRGRCAPGLCRAKDREQSPIFKGRVDGERRRRRPETSIAEDTPASSCPWCAVTSLLCCIAHAAARGRQRNRVVPCACLTSCVPPASTLLPGGTAPPKLTWPLGKFLSDVHLRQAREQVLEGGSSLLAARTRVAELAPPGNPTSRARALRSLQDCVGPPPDDCMCVKERKKTDKPREGWEDGTPPPHRDFERRRRLPVPKGAVKKERKKTDNPREGE